MGQEFSTKSIQFVFEPGKMTEAQAKQITAAIKYAEEMKLEVKITYMK
jgi:hypothetical protein